MAPDGAGHDGRRGEEYPSGLPLGGHRWPHKDYFFHRDGLSDSVDFDRLVGGESVSFDVESNPRGPRATNVKAAE
jgi:hypothetical protein